MDKQVNLCSGEFNNIDFKDKRLNKRFSDTAEKLFSKSIASINEACGSWKDTKAAYRLFNNNKVTVEEIQKSHKANLHERIKGHDLIFAIQDTTFLNYTHHPNKKGLGPIGALRDEQKGFMMHSSLIITEQGLPLGLATQEFLIRPEAKNTKSRYRPIEEKESYRWLTALGDTESLINKETNVISICDREGDIYELFDKAENISAKILIRASHDRALIDKNQHLRAYIASQKVRGIKKVSVAPHKNRKKREANLEVRVTPVTFRAPYKPKSVINDRVDPITLYAISATEINPPEGEQPLNWILLTNIKTEDFKEACLRIDWYCLRWQIEIFHKILKSGCNVEKCRLENTDRLFRYLSLFGVIAWRILWMTQVKRIDPNLECTIVLNKEEWQPLYCMIKKTKILPEKTPTISEAITWIAMIGGFMARKNDGEPGPTVIWRGWQRLADIAYGWPLP